MDMVIGIPRALLFHYYGEKWIEFFRHLGVETILSPDTNREIVKRGIALSVDEACFSSKVYIGHVDWLSTRCDIVFSPRMENTGVREDFCPRIFGMHDVIAHTFPELKLLNADINYLFRRREVDAFTNMGEQLGFTAEKSRKAYTAANEKFFAERTKVIENQMKLFNRKGLKVLLVSHSYNIYDSHIGRDIIDYFKSQKVTTIFADLVDTKMAREKTKEIYGNRVYWRVNATLMGAVELYKDKVDGIVLVTTFPCGPDSIFNDILIRSSGDKPILSLMIDELDASAGLQTRLESFIDILEAKK